MHERERETVKKMQSWLVLLLPLFVMGQSALPMPLQLDDPGFRKILVQVDSLLIGGQPDSAAITQLPGRGVTTVICLRTPEELANRSGLPFAEADLVASLGMQFIHLPLDGDAYPYSPLAVDSLARVLRQLRGKALLHCTSGWRASHLWAAYLILQRGYPVADALAHARQINLGRYPVIDLLGRELQCSDE
jgi:uncharacterized protein (TIGR01244 family)